MPNIPISGNIYSEGSSLGDFPAQGAGGWNYTEAFNGTLSIITGAGANHGNYSYFPTAGEINEANQCLATSGTFAPTLGTCVFQDGTWGLEVCASVTWIDERTPAEGGCGCTRFDPTCIFIPGSNDPCENLSHENQVMGPFECEAVNEQITSSFSGFNTPPTYQACAAQPGLSNPGSLTVTPGGQISYQPSAGQLSPQTPFTETVCVEAISSDPAGCNNVAFSVFLNFDPPTYPAQTMSPTQVCEYNSQQIPAVGASGGGGFTYAACAAQPSLSNPGGLVVTGTGLLSYVPNNPNLGSQAFTEQACVVVTPNDPACPPITIFVNLQFLAQSHPDDQFLDLDCAFSEQIDSTGAVNMNPPITYSLCQGGSPFIPDLAVSPTGVLSGTASPVLAGSNVQVTVCATSDNCPPQEFTVTLGFLPFCNDFGFDLPQSP